MPLEPVLLPELELVSLGELVLLEPLVPPVLPVVLVLPPVPLVPVVLPEVPPAAPALVPEAPDDFFADFLCFLAFFFFGVALLAPVSLWPEEVADGVEVLAPEPEAPLVSPDAPVEVLPLVEEPLMPVPDVPLPDVPDVPDAPLPDVPDAPEDPEAPLDEVPLAPEEPGEVAPGVDAEVPLPPAMPASLPVPAPVAPVWLCAVGLDEVVEDLLVSEEELCASAIEDTDAISTSDKDRRVVFNAMRDSFELKEKHYRCRTLDAASAFLFSKMKKTYGWPGSIVAGVCSLHRWGP